MVDTSLIHERMEVIGADGEHVGTVDQVEGGTRIRLAHFSSRSGQFHYVPVEWIVSIDGERMFINKSKAEAVHFWHPEIIDPNRDV